MAEALGFVTVSLILLGVIGVLWTLRSERFSLVTIKQDQAQIHGIPFYTKKAICKLEKIWIEPVFTVNYTKTTKYQFVEPPANEKQKAPDPIVQSATKMLSLSQVRSPEMSELFRMVAATAGDMPRESLNAIDRTWNRFALGTPDYVPLGKTVEGLLATSDAVLISDTASVDVVTDYATVYYYNAMRPLIGSGEVAIKLDGDGTLSEASAKVEGKSVESLLNFLPVGDLVGKIREEPVKDEPTDEERQIAPEVREKLKRVIQLQLTVTQREYRHIRTQYKPYAELRNPDGKQFSMRIETAPDTGGKKASENAVEVSGTITLPTKAKGA
jgi:hypothetical protein